MQTTSLSQQIPQPSVGAACSDVKDTRQWWVYLLACRGGRTYASVAINVAARFDLHARGKGAKFTRANPPVAILGKRPFISQSAALQAEHALKQLSREEKLSWAAAPESHDAQG